MKKNTKQKSTSDLGRRRFERVPLTGDWGLAKAMLGGRAVWPTNESSDIFDISYQGAALGRPALLDPRVNQEIILQFEFPGSEAIVVPARVAWANERLIGLEFLHLAIEARSRIDEFLEDRLIGRYLRPVGANYFNNQDDFTHWYRGPKETNVFLWIKKNDDITKAVIELDGQTLIYENRELHGGGSVDLNKKMPNEPELHILLDRETPLVKRVMELLSQIDEHQEPLKKLLESLMKVQ